MKEGRTTAKVAMTDPTTLPVEVNPTYVAALIPLFLMSRKVFLKLLCDFTLFYQELLLI